MFRFILLLYLLSLPPWSYATEQSGPNAKTQNGMIDISGWDFPSAGPLRLDGDWRIVWHEYIDPTNPEALREAYSRSKAQAVPGDWQPPPGYGGFERNQGFATLLLKIKGWPQTTKAYDLYTRTVGTAYRLAIVPLSDPTQIQWVLKAGVPGQTPKETTPYSRSEVGSFGWSGHDEAMLVMHLANFDHRTGGVHYSIFLGEGGQGTRLHRKDQVSEIIALAMILIVGLYNFSLYLQRREDLSSLWLSFYCFSTIVRGLTATSLFSDLIPSQDRWVYDLKIGLEYTTIALNTTLLGMFLMHCFPKYFHRRVIQGFLLLAGGFAIFAFALPPYRLTQHLASFQLFLAIVSLYLLVSWIRAIWHREEAAILGFSGGLVLLACAVHDVLVSQNLISSYYIVPYGLVAFLLFQSLVIGQRFAKAFRKAEYLSLALQDEVERQTRDIKSILKHIRQGIFSVTQAEMKVDGQHSAYLTQVLGVEDPSNSTIQSLILDKAELSSDEKAQLEASLAAMLGEFSLAFEMNESALKKELIYRQTENADAQILELDWSPVLDRQGNIEKVLVCVRDVTEVRQLKLVSEKREKDLKMIMELMMIPEEQFQRFYQRATEQIAENKDLICGDYEPKNEIVRRLFMNMHTIKGSARSYYLNALSSRAHDLEQTYSAIQKQEQNWDHEQLLKDLDTIQELLNRYQSIGEERLGWSMRKKTVKIERSVLRNMMAQLQSLTLSRSSDQDIVDQVQEELGIHSFDSLFFIVEEAFRGTDSVARDLGKPAPVLHVTHGGLRLQDRAAEVIHNALLHMFRNSVDHGIEPAEMRVKCQKPEAGQIHVNCSVVQDRLLILYQDDGIGLDLEAIRNKARDRGLLSGSRSYSRLEIASLIFISGFSTKSAVSEISGRGVGLDAVRTYVESLGGTITICLENESKGSYTPFAFQISLPAEYLCLGPTALRTAS